MGPDAPDMTKSPARRSCPLRACDGLFLRVERDQRGCRTEDLIAYGPVGVGPPGPQGGLDPGAAVEAGTEVGCAASGEDLGAGLFGQAK